MDFPIWICETAYYHKVDSKMEYYQMQNRTIAWDYDEEISDETPSTTIGMDQATYTAQYMENHDEDNIEEPAEDTTFAHELYGQLQNPMLSNIWEFSAMRNNLSSAMDDSLAYLEQVKYNIIHYRTVC